MARKAKTKSISFTVEYFDEYDYLHSMKGASEYVCKLVRADRLSKEEDVNELAKQVEDLLMKMEGLRRRKEES